MNILVCIKQVPDTGTRIRLLNDGKGIDGSDIEWVINPYDEFALEEALRIKERKQGGEVIVFSLGPSRVEKSLRTALAMGADRAYLIEAQEKKDPIFVAQALGQVIKEEKSWGLILTGKGAVDENHSATGAMLAEVLNISQVGFVVKIEEPKEGHWLCKRQMEKGVKEQVFIQCPALITVEKGINKPRYPSLPGIMKAKKKEIKKITLSDLNISEDTQSISFHSYSLPPPPPAPQLISGTAEEQAKKLISILKEKEKVIDT